MRKPLGITMFICALALHGAGCAAPCPLVPEEDCDSHIPNNECRYVCADEAQAESDDDGEAAQEAGAPTNEHGQSGGHLSDDEDVETDEE